MNVENVKHLFVSASERYPEFDEWVTLILQDGFVTVGCKKPFGWTVFNPLDLLENNENLRVDYWLDLTSLTTKKRAVELAEKAFIVGEDREYHNKFGKITCEYPHKTGFIDQNKNNL